MRLTWSALAIADRMAIFDFIERDNPAAAIRIDAKIEAGIRQLLQFPESGRTGRVSGPENWSLREHPILPPIRFFLIESVFCAFCMVLRFGQIASEPF